MQKKKKLFVQKQPLASTRKRSYLGLFLWAALGLIVLVVMASFATHQKSTEHEARKPVAEEGMVLRPIPRPDDLAQDKDAEEPDMGGEGTVAGTVPVSETVPGTVPETGTQTVASIPDFKSFPAPREGAGAGAPEQVAPSTEPFKTATESAGPSAGTAPSPENPPVDPTSNAVEKPAAATPADQGGSLKKTQIPARSKPTAPGPTPAATKQKRSPASSGPPSAPKPASAAAASTPPKTPSPSEKPGKTAVQAQSKPMYVVQVGSFKDKQNAEEMKQSLVKRGYDVVVKTQNHQKLGQLYVIQLQPVPEESKASTLMTQIGHEEKARPVMLKVHSESVNR